MIMLAIIMINFVVFTEKSPNIFSLTHTPKLSINSPIKHKAKYFIIFLNNITTSIISTI